MAGGLACGVYDSCNVDDIHFIAEQTRADVVFVDSPQRLKRILAVKQRHPLAAVVQYLGYPADEGAFLHSWSDLIKYSPALLVCLSVYVSLCLSPPQSFPVSRNPPPTCSMGRDLTAGSETGRELEGRISALRPNKPAIVAFTPGTSADPKVLLLLPAA